MCQICVCSVTIGLVIIVVGYMFESNFVTWAYYIKAPRGSQNRLELRVWGWGAHRCRRWRRPEGEIRGMAWGSGRPAEEEVWGVGWKGDAGARRPWVAVVSGSAGAGSGGDGGHLGGVGRRGRWKFSPVM
jgi:hypothetical protein